MTRSILIPLAAITLLVVPAGGSHAQIPDEFTNLSVLPKEISKRELVGIMRGFAGGLGVRCNHCHVGPENLQGMDFATDEKQTKKVAREMIKMVDAINGEHLAAIDTGREERVEVECRTCHHGLSVPTTVEDLLARTIDAEGVNPALKLYRELRAEHYGKSAYDFSSGPLNGLAERLGRSEKLDEALAVVRLNIEFHEDDSFTRMMLGGLHQARGERAEAIAAFRKAIELDPENSWAVRQLAALESAAGDEDE